MELRYLNDTLSKSEVQEFLHKYNRPDERKCISCPSKFKSEGAHNRKCPKCKAKQKLFDRLVHKMSGKFRSCNHFIGEID